MDRIVCVNCGRELGLLSLKDRLADGFVCLQCLVPVGITRLENSAAFSSAEVRALISARTSLIENFSPTRKIGSHLKIDDVTKAFKVRKEVFAFSNLASFELLEDGEIVTSGGLGRALVGGALFGGVGAVVGGVTGGKRSRNVTTSMSIQLNLRNCHRTTVTIPFIKSEMKQNSSVYKSIRATAGECLSALQTIIDSQEQAIHTERAETAFNSTADEILKFKQLLDAGIISVEEFEAKKQQLLDL